MLNHFQHSRFFVLNSIFDLNRKNYRHHHLLHNRLIERYSIYQFRDSPCKLYQFRNSILFELYSISLDLSTFDRQFR
jgi:hypothetical protein